MVLPVPAAGVSIHFRPLHGPPAVDLREPPARGDPPPGEVEARGPPAGRAAPGAPQWQTPLARSLCPRQLVGRSPAGAAAVPATVSLSPSRRGTPGPGPPG